VKVVAGRFLSAFLGIAAGLGVSSVLLFLWLGARNGRLNGETTSASVLAVVLSGSALIWLRSRRRDAEVARDTRRSPLWLIIALVFSGIAASAAFVLLSLHSPHGGWDAISDWNRHARFMFIGGPHWRDVFSSAEAEWTPGYPMLIAGAIAHCWAFAERETLLAPAVVAFLFAAAAVGLLVSSLSLLRNSSQGLIAGVILLCSPQFITQGSTQYADVPLAAFYLGAVALLCLHDAVQEHRGWLVMSGLMTGFAAWTKPEGLLFVLVILVVRSLIVSVARGPKIWLLEFRTFLLGLLPVLVLVLYFKFHMVGAVSDLIQGQTTGSFLQRALSASRYVTTAKAFAGQLLGFGGWVVMLPPLLLMYLLLVGVNRKRQDASAIFTGLLILVVMSGGYFMVYVVTPHDLAWHLKFSIDRVLMQLWPLALFTFFLIARTPEECAEDGDASSIGMKTSEKQAI
jgi:Dolichyl-phosphate-mannose-protein mannosyltransferase